MITATIVIILAEIFGISGAFMTLTTGLLCLINDGVLFNLIINLSRK